MSTATAAAPRPIRSTIQARLDRLRWSPFDTRMVSGLGAAGILDGLQITIADKATNDDAKDLLYEQLKSVLGDLGMHHHHLLPHHAYLNNENPVAGVAHQAGTCRFGTDPGTSVLDVKCKAQELDHLLERARATSPTSTAASVR